MALTSKISLSVVAELTSALDLATASVPLSLIETVRLASGTGADQADKVWHDQRTLAASGTEDLDLAGVLTDALGVTVTMAKLKALIISAAAGNTNNVNVSRPASNGVPWALAAGDGIPVVPGGQLWLVAPNATAYAVTAGTGDLITVTNSGAGSSVTYDVVLIGTSA